MDRLFLEILPRLESKDCQFTRVKTTIRQKGDNVLKGFIEIVGSNIESYEKGKEAEKLAKAGRLPKADFKIKVGACQQVLTGEVKMFQDQLLGVEDKIAKINQATADSNSEEKAMLERFRKQKIFFENKLALSQINLKAADSGQYSPMIFAPLN